MLGIALKARCCSASIASASCTCARGAAAQPGVSGLQAEHLGALCLSDDGRPWQRPQSIWTAPASA